MTASNPITEPVNQTPESLSEQGEPHPGEKQGNPRGWRTSPAFSAAEIAVVLVAAVALAILASWPLALHLGSRISPDLGDPVRTAWQIAWVGHAMLHDPLHLFDSNAFYPHPLSLAFSDSLLGYGPAAFFGSGTIAALVRYNLLFLGAWSLCFVGAYLLARELGLNKLPSAASGVAFAYAPYRVTEAGHLHVISSGGIALALFVLLRGYRNERIGVIAAGWLISAWQVSLGFTLGLQYCYLLAALAILITWHWWRRGHKAPERRLALITLAGILLVGAVGVYEARPYLKVSHDYPSARRTIAEVETYSAGPAAWLSASSENRVWGSLTAGIRAHVNSKNESVLFPGLGIFVLALIGLATGALGRRARIGLAVGAVCCAVLALGLGLTGAGYPYRLLYDFAPGWNGVRVPGRVFTMATLFLALLAGAGAQWLILFVRERSQSAFGSLPWQPAVPALTAAILLIGLFGEGAGHMANPVVPQPAKAEIGLPGPILDLPTDGASDRVWQYFSTDGFPQIPVGNSTFDIPAVDDLRGGMRGFPDLASVEKLRYYGIRTVVLHTKLPALPGLHGYSVAEPPDPRAAAAKQVSGLGITRRVSGEIVIYEIGQGPKALHGSDR